MNDQQLIDALRRLDVPVAVDAAFEETLFVRLQRERRPRRDDRMLLLVAAAVLLALVVGAAFAAGQLRERTQIVDLPPSPERTTVFIAEPTLRSSIAEASLPAINDDVPFVIPENTHTASTPEEVVEATRSLRTGFYGDPYPPRTLARVTWVPANTAFSAEHEAFATTDGNEVCCFADPWWAVEVVASDPDHRYLLMLWDGSLDIFNAVDAPPSTPQAPLTAPSPRSDPAAPLVLTASDGRSITAQVIPGPDPVNFAQFAGLRSIAGELWGTVFYPYRDGAPSYDFRLDAATNALVRDQPPAEPTPLVQLNLSQGGVPVEVDEFGRWSHVTGGVEVRDATSGALIRTFQTREGPGHPYRGIPFPPAFGSLWDTDRATGVVYRIDPVTDSDLAKIPLGVDTDYERCGDPVPVDVVRGLPASMVVQCDGIAVAIDPSTNRVVRTMVASIYNSIVIDGTWWWFEWFDDPQDEPWDRPGLLHATDVEGGRPHVTLDIGTPAVAGTEPVVVGDSLWFIAAERTGPDTAYGAYSRLARIPIAELKAVLAVSDR